MPQNWGYCHSDSCLFILGNQDWCSSGITMATENWSAAEIANRQSLDDFHSAFDVVFVDTTGYVNLCADMSAAHYRLVLLLIFACLCVIYYLWQGGGCAIRSLCLSFDLSACRITVKLISRFHWTWCCDWAYHAGELLNFWWRSSLGYRFWIAFLFPSPLQYRGF